MELSIVSTLLGNRENILEKWKVELQNLKQEQYFISISDDSYASMNNEFMEFLLRTLDHNHKNSKEKVSHFTDKYIQNGWPLVYFTKGLQAFRRVMLNVLKEEEKDVNLLVDKFVEIDEWCDSVINQLVHDYTGSWENVFEMQKVSLLELSASLIPVFDEITVMPLVGTIDTARAKLIMENLLNGIIKHRSKVVLIDITGVPVVDTMVAHHIIQASEAVRLVGAECILVGIRPEIAQTIVNLGIDLARFPTKSTLRKGMETALAITNKQISEV
ncbi:STAS domain-containing protein [Alkalihalobacillus pseudalcaliphilus]|uniref:STAS domain-containing protein n=1 Tax=Alkalihalobacillus pseudalcaliphilus TaxID=79884 RepID=UPI00064D8E58|nr:STAS domain-containing protein [Alkalihalobacillus pseudalcaliphilus]KMK76924.1 RsbT co-antagonist protein RsbRA [Alkalihalobacillus pseudalcaliphilus]